MYLTTSFITLALAVSPSLADFHIFCGNANSGLGGGQTNDECVFFNNPPSCDDALHKSIAMTFGFDNDASKKGLACDGCGGKAVKDWDVKRFEVHDRKENIFNDAGKENHFTLYKGSDGGYNMVDTDNVSIGTCHRPAKPQDVDCSMGTAAIFYQEFAICETKVTIKDSN